MSLVVKVEGNTAIYSLLTSVLNLDTKDVAYVTITIIESIAATNFDIIVYDIRTNVVLKHMSRPGGTYQLDLPSFNSVIVVINPAQGFNWLPSTPYTVGDLVMSTSFGGYFQRIVDAYSGTTEPIWSTGLVEDGYIPDCWQYVSELSNAQVLGPIIPTRL